MCVTCEIDLINEVVRLHTALHYSSPSLSFTQNWVRVILTIIDIDHALINTVIHCSSNLGIVYQYMYSIDLPQASINSTGVEAESAFLLKGKSKDYLGGIELW